MSTKIRVSTKQGNLLGNAEKDYDGKTFYSFHGIPYAKPPLGDLRFKAPLPPDPWTGDRDATEEASECNSFHMLHLTPIGSEDCLYLNVYTPDMKSKKPGMVWIHGGAYVSGSSKRELYGPEFLVREDVVLVTMNYRLGVLGFLSLRDPKLGVTGNAAFKDMVMALKWVQENISNFGGDPNNVTIFGESAGAGCVHYLMLSPKAKGLFHKVIAQSGTAISLWSKGTCVGKELAEIFGCNSDDEAEQLKTLQSVTKDELLSAQYKIADKFNGCDIRPHGPVVEPDVPDAFISKDPVEILKSGDYNQVPLIMGFTSREGILFEIMGKRLQRSYRITDLVQQIPHNLKYDESKRDEIAAKIKQFYFGDADPATANVDWHILFTSDQHFLREIFTALKLHYKTMKQPIYLYRMSIESDLNAYKVFWEVSNKGVSHADDLGYLFKNAITPEIRPNSIEEIGMKRFTKLWTNFAKFSDPNGKTTTDLIPVKWEPIKNEIMNFLDIGENLTVGVNPEHERMQFWEKLYKDYALN